jgi:aryl-alcohol dehydrogenase-like predicted oxidoreductase
LIGYPCLGRAAERKDEGSAAPAVRHTAASITLASGAPTKGQLQGSTHSLPIPGTTSLEHLRQNLEARSLSLTDAEMKALDNIAQP